MRVYATLFVHDDDLPSHVIFSIQAFDMLNWLHLWKYDVTDDMRYLISCRINRKFYRV